MLEDAKNCFSVWRNKEQTKNIYYNRADVGVDRQILCAVDGKCELVHLAISAKKINKVLMFWI